ncbi:MAG: DUF86 domain-containing protein [Planctomycetota bacterium]
MIDDVILNKKESIERCIKQIRAYYEKPSGLPFEEDFFKQDAIAINIQRASELCIDLANHVVKRKRLGIPKESKESFALLAQAGIIPKKLLKQLEGMVGFRNTLVHVYQELEIRIMKDVIEHHLDDLILFTVHIMEIP